MIEDEVGAVARAFYNAQQNARGWQQEPELLKEQFRRDACTAIALAGRLRGTASVQSINPLVVHGELQQARDLLLNSRALSVLPDSDFRAVLRGPDHIFDVANEAHSRIIGSRDVFGQPVREALPELVEQGYCDLLDRVYATRRPFVGRELSIGIQTKPGAPLEVHVVDFVYRPIEDASGHVRGIFLEGFDRTGWARA